MTQISKYKTSGKTPVSGCPELATLLPVELFKALGDANRVAILAGLATGGQTQTVSEVAECCPINLSVVSRHLKILERAGVLESEKHGREVLYQVRIAHLVGVLRGIADGLDACCPDGVAIITDGSARDAGTA